MKNPMQKTLKIWMGNSPEHTCLPCELVTTIQGHIALRNARGHRALIYFHVK